MAFLSFFISKKKKQHVNFLFSKVAGQNVYDETNKKINIIQINAYLDLLNLSYQKGLMTYMYKVYLKYKFQIFFFSYIVEKVLKDV